MIYWDMMRDEKQNIGLFLPTVHVASGGGGTGGQGHFQPQPHTCEYVKDGFISCLYTNGSTLAHDPNCCKCDCLEKRLNGHIYDCHWRLLMVLVTEWYINNIDVFGP